MTTTRQALRAALALAAGLGMVSLGATASPPAALQAPAQAQKPTFRSGLDLVVVRDAEHLFRLEDERLNVFGKARSSITYSGIKETVADSGVGSDAFTDFIDVRPHMLANTGDFIHEGNAGGQHGVRRIFRHFRRQNIHGENPIVGQHEGSVNFFQNQSRAKRVGANHDSVRFHAILNGRAFFENFRI